MYFSAFHFGGVQAATVPTYVGQGGGGTCICIGRLRELCLDLEYNPYRETGGEHGDCDSSPQSTGGLISKMIRVDTLHMSEL